MKLTAYETWTPAAPAPDPRAAPLNAIAATLAAIVEREGPIVTTLAIRRYVGAVEGLSRAGGSTRNTLHAALADLAEAGRIELVAELGNDDTDALVAASPGVKCRARTRADRTIQEIPICELADGFLLVRRTRGVSRYTESVQRALLHALELRRLTGTTADRLRAAWHASQRWIDEDGPAAAAANLDDRALPASLQGAGQRTDAPKAPTTAPGVAPWQAALSTGPTTIRSNPPADPDSDE